METARAVSLVGSQHQSPADTVGVAPLSLWNHVSMQDKEDIPSASFASLAHPIPAQDPLQPPGWETQAQGLAGSAPAPPATSLSSPRLSPARLFCPIIPTPL